MHASVNFRIFHLLILYLTEVVIKTHTAVVLQAGLYRWSLISRSNGGTQIEGDWEQSIAENI
jgi:hypothetical protein